MSELSEEWGHTTLGEVVETNTSSINKHYKHNEIYYLDTGSITLGKIDSLQLLLLKDAPSRAKRLVKNNSIVYSTVRPIHRHYGIITNPAVNLVVSTGFTVIDSIENKADNTFIYYFLTANKIVQKLDMIANGTVSTYPSIKPIDIESLSINLPPLPEQKAIANILSVFDKKIELLCEQNEKLETLAQTIFKEWFVNFRFPYATGEMVDSTLGKIPKGWRVGDLSEIAEFLNGLALQKYPPIAEHETLPVIKIRELKQGITAQTDRANTELDKKYIIENGDILFSWSGSLEVVIWKYGKGALNQHLFKVNSKTYPKWFYYYWTLFHLREFRAIASHKATTMGHIQRKHLDEAKVLIPNIDLMEQGTELFTSIIEKIILTNDQIKTLTKIRDTLLPKLMSGEVRVKGFGS